MTLFTTQAWSPSTTGSFGDVARSVALARDTVRAKWSTSKQRIVVATADAAASASSSATSSLSTANAHTYMELPEYQWLRLSTQWSQYKSLPPPASVAAFAARFDDYHTCADTESDLGRILTAIVFWNVHDIDSRALLAKLLPCGGTLPAPLTFQPLHAISHMEAQPGAPSCLSRTRSHEMAAYIDCLIQLHQQFPTQPLIAFLHDCHMSALDDVLATHTPWLCNRAARHGLVGVLSVLHRDLHRPVDASTVATAAKHGHMQILSLLCGDWGHRIPFAALAWAARRCQIACLQFLIPRVLHDDTYLALSTRQWMRLGMSAIRSGDAKATRVLEYFLCAMQEDRAVNMDGVVDAWARAATRAGETAALAWICTAPELVDRVRTAVRPADLALLAAFEGRLACLAFLHDQFGGAAIWNASICAAAAYNGHLGCLEYAHRNHCPWDSFTCSSAPVAANQAMGLQCLRFARQHGCRWTSATLQNAAFFKNTPCILYATRHRCPVPIHAEQPVLLPFLPPPADHEAHGELVATDLAEEKRWDHRRRRASTLDSTQSSIAPRRASEDDATQGPLMFTMDE